MKLFICALLGVIIVQGCLAYERETSDEEVYPRLEATATPTRRPFARRTTYQPPTPVTPDADDDDDEVEFVTTRTPSRRQNTRCSEVICDIKCRVNGCPMSECLDNGRCRCYCPKSVDPVQAFFSSILTSHMEPGLRVHFGPSVFRRPIPHPSFPEMPAFPDMPAMPEMPAMPDFPQFPDPTGPFMGHTKIFSTVSQTCATKQDCTEACTQCNVTNCVYGFCECTACNRSEVDLATPKSNVVKTCQRARQCGAHCQGCSSVMCRYGVCECNMCKKPEQDKDDESRVTATSIPTTTMDPFITQEAVTTPVATETTTQEATTQEISTTDFSKDLIEEPEDSTEVTFVTSNATAPEEHAGGKRECVPKRCNHSCWERQCRKFSCAGDKCVCDQCPHEVVVLSNDGKKDAEGDDDQMEKNRYEIVF